MSSMKNKRQKPYDTLLTVECLEDRCLLAGSRFLEPVSSSGGVVASINAEASAVGIDVLDHGGNAIDAAVATVFAVGVTRPDAGGIGGGGFLVYRGRDHTVAALDFRETAPMAVQPDVFTKEPGVHDVMAGHRVVGVPGTVAGLAAALQKHGTISLHQAIMGFGPQAASNPCAVTVRYAYQLAKCGITVTAELAKAEQDSWAELAFYPETSRIYLVGGATPYQPGMTLVQEDQAKSLRCIAELGVSAFYDSTRTCEHLQRQSIAQLIADDMAAADENDDTNPVLQSRFTGQPNDLGLMTTADLGSYQAIWRKPLRGRYRGHQIIAMPAPTSGGIATLEILNILEGFPLNSVTADTDGIQRDYRRSQADHLHVLAESQKIAFADRAKYVADPDRLYDFDGDGDREPVPTSILTSKEYAAARRAEIDQDRANSYGPGDVKADGGNTNHVSVIDKNGNAVSVTTTIESQFGSGVVAPGTGFLLNNQLTDFDKPGFANQPEAGKRPRSSMSPTIVLRHRQPILVTGGRGGATIILGVVQNIVNVVDFGLDIAHAVDGERIDAAAKWNPGSTCSGLTLEDARIDDAVENELARRGHHLCLDGEYGAKPHLAVAGIDPATGRKLAVTDPRHFHNPPLYPVQNTAAAQTDDAPSHGDTASPHDGSAAGVLGLDSYADVSLLLASLQEDEARNALTGVEDSSLDNTVAV